jgi:hypothetical protein
MIPRRGMLAAAGGALVLAAGAALNPVAATSIALSLSSWTGGTNHQQPMQIEKATTGGRKNVRNQCGSRDACLAMIAAGLIAFRLAGFAWTPAHQPAARLPSADSLSTVFSAASDESLQAPRSSPPRRASDILENYTGC